MEPSKTSKQERYIAAAGYLFELGYIISWLTRTESEFTKFHFKQENKIINFVIIPGTIVLFAGILLDHIASKFLIYIGVAIILASFINSIKGAWHAIRGEKKKAIKI